MKRYEYKDVRLTEEQKQAIIQCFNKNFGSEDHIWLFGSRVDLNKKGGDIDLYIETQIHDIEQALRNKRSFWVDLLREIGEQKIDVIINIPDTNQELLIYKEAKANGVKLQ